MRKLLYLASFLISAFLTYQIATRPSWEDLESQLYGELAALNEPKTRNEKAVLKCTARIATSASEKAGCKIDSNVTVIENVRKCQEGALTFSLAMCFYSNGDTDTVYKQTNGK